MLDTNKTHIEVAEQALLDLLATGALRPGQRVVETRMAVEIGLSRNAVREALNRLVVVGLVEYEPYRGYRLRQFGIKDLLDLYELREAIEPIAARNAAEVADASAVEAIADACRRFDAAVEASDLKAAWRSDCDIHCAIVEASGNKQFARTYQYFRVMTSLTWAFGHGQLSGPEVARGSWRDNARANETHQKILQAIRDGDSGQAYELVLTHVIKGRESFLRNQVPAIARHGIPADLADAQPAGALAAEHTESSVVPA